MNIDGVAPSGLTWVEVTDKFKPLLLMYDEFFKEMYEKDDNVTIIYQAGEMYTHEDSQGVPQTDLYTITWWTEAIQKYELFNKQPAEAVKHLMNKKFIQYMAHRVLKGTFVYSTP